ncbi:hypothetical protein DFH09DRAFT_177348 [Mycena vulgaris]|nr:hypothetical protein DFH09DRAFT_177348 [Mycena vulgaris]
MNFKLLTFLGLVVVFLGNFYPSLGKETNASRFRRGLPPLPPRFALRNKGSTASATVTSWPSSTPRPRFSARSGRIQVFAGNTSLGYVRNSTPINSINLGGVPKQDLRVETVSERAPFDIIVTNPNFLSPFYVGVLVSRNLDARELATMTLSNVDRARSNFRATGPGKSYVQSQIWSISSNTNELEARYLNPDGSKSSLFVAYDAHENELYFVGDIDFFNSASPASLVKLFLSED